jgi:hypothetical protein
MIANATGFVLRFAAVAVVGTLFIPFAAPLVSLSELPEPLAQWHDRLQSIPAVRHWTAVLRTRFRPPAAADDPPAPLPPEAASPGGFACAPAPAALPASGAPAAPPAQAVWALVRTADAPVYSRAGKYLRKIEPGTALVVRDILSTRSGEFAVSARPDTPPADEPFLVRTVDLDLQNGRLQAVPQRRVELLASRARLSAELEQVRRDLAHGRRLDNPHFAEYDEARKRYGAQCRRMQELQAKRDAAADDSRMAFEDELRRQKGDEIALRQAYEQARGAYEAWNAAHPAPAAARPPQLVALETRIASIDSQLAEEWPAE